MFGWIRFDSAFTKSPNDWYLVAKVLFIFFPEFQNLGVFSCFISGIGFFLVCVTFRVFPSSRFEDFMGNFLVFVTYIQEFPRVVFACILNPE